MQKTTTLAKLKLFARRALAYEIDIFILFTGILLTQGLLYLLNANPIVRLMVSGQAFTGGQLHLWVLATVSWPLWFYYALLHSSKWQATLGQRLMKLHVTTTDGGRLAFGPAFVRAIVMLIPFEVNHAVMFHLGNFGPEASAPTPAFWMGYTAVWLLIVAYIVAALVTPRQQSLHDFVVGTIVTSKP